MASLLRYDAIRTGIMLVIFQVRGAAITHRGWYLSKPLPWDGEEPKSELVDRQAVERIEYDVRRRAPRTSLLRQRSVLVVLLCWRALPNGFLLRSVSHGLLFAQFLRTSLQKGIYVLVREMCEEVALQLGSCKGRSDECECGRGRKGKREQELGIIYPAVAAET